MPMPRSQTLASLLSEITERHPAREAVVAGATRLSYRQLADEVERTARGLRALGVRRVTRWPC